MKKILIFSTLIASLSSINAFEYEIEKGWQQIGAVENIKDLKIFNNKCIDYLWKYENNKENPLWKLHIANNKSYSYSGETIDALNKGEGVWVKASDDCTILINSLDTPPMPPILKEDTDSEEENNNGNNSIYSSCKEILKAGKSTGDGIYTIDPDGNGEVEPFKAYCDMTTEGGGWTLIMNINEAKGYRVWNDANIYAKNSNTTDNYILDSKLIKPIAKTSDEIRYNCKNNQNTVLDIKTHYEIWKERSYSTGEGCKQGFNFRPGIEYFKKVEGSKHNPSRHVPSDCAGDFSNHRLVFYPIGISKDDWYMPVGFQKGLKCAKREAQYMRIWYK